MIVVEYMENGSLDSFLRVSVEVIKELIMSVSGIFVVNKQMKKADIKSNNSISL